MFSCPRVSEFKKTCVTSVICHPLPCRLEGQTGTMMYVLHEAFENVIV